MLYTTRPFLLSSRVVDIHRNDGCERICGEVGQGSPKRSLPSSGSGMIQTMFALPQNGSSIGVHKKSQSHGIRLKNQDRRIVGARARIHTPKLALLPPSANHFPFLLLSVLFHHLQQRSLPRSIAAFLGRMEE